MKTISLIFKRNKGNQGNTMTSKTVPTDKKLGIFSIIFALLYIFSELTFNLGLVDFLNSPNTEMDTFHTLELFGRFLSSIGMGGFITSIICLLLKKMNISFIISIILFVVFSALSYGAQTVVFNKILDGMSPEQKLSAYAFGVYRNLNLNNQVSLKVLNGENKNYDLVVNSMLGVFTTVPKVEDNITQTVKKFFHAENNVDQATLGKIYDELNVSLPNFDDYWGIYVIESRKYQNYSGIYKKMYHKKFVEAIGIEPGLSRTQFEQHLKGQIPSIQKAKDIVIVPANEGINLKELRIKDIPEGLNKKDWVSFVNKHIDNAIESVQFTEKNIDKLPHSENIISSVIITPIAILLSMLALFLNIIVFFARFTKIGAIVLTGGLIFLATSWNYNPYSISPTLNKLIGLETNLFAVMSPYTKVIHAIAINDNNPNTYQIIRIEKPKMPDMSKLKDELDSKFKNLSSVDSGEKTEGMAAMDKLQKEIKVDKERIDDKNYYGELRKENPYAK